MTNLPKTLISICGPLNAHAMHEVKVRHTFTVNSKIFVRIIFS